MALPALLTTAFDAHQQQISYICTRYQQNDGDGSHQDPKHIADVADHISLERLKTGGEIGFFKYLDAETCWWWEALRGNRNEASQIGGGLLQSNSWLQPCQAVDAETAERRFAAIKLPRHDNINVITIQEFEVAG